jgi:hypothetical protein
LKKRPKAELLLCLSNCVRDAKKPGSRVRILETKKAKKGENHEKFPPFLPVLLPVIHDIVLIFFRQPAPRKRSRNR